MPHPGRFPTSPAHSPAFLWTVAVAFLLLLPNLPSAGIAPWPGLAGFIALPRLDWLAHAALFAVGALLVHRSFRRLGLARPLLVAVLAVVLYSLALEEAQRFVPGRLTEFADGLANAVGACGYAGLRVWRG